MAPTTSNTQTSTLTKPNGRSTNVVSNTVEHETHSICFAFPISQMGSPASHLKAQKAAVPVETSSFQRLFQPLYCPKLVPKLLFASHPKMQERLLTAPPPPPGARRIKNGCMTSALSGSQEWGGVKMVALPLPHWGPGSKEHKMAPCLGVPEEWLHKPCTFVVLLSYPTLTYMMYLTSEPLYPSHPLSRGLIPRSRSVGPGLG